MKPFNKRRPGKSSFDKSRDKRSFEKSGKPSFTKRRDEGESDRPFRKSERPSFAKRRDEGDKPFRKSERLSFAKRGEERGKPLRKSDSFAQKQNETTGLIRLNKYISNSGICSRREADELIKAGLITVNDKIVTELGTKISAGDDVKYNGERMRNERKRYVLLNKPKDYITTTDDPEKRNTVMELIKEACRERVYPVGRLDRNTTGLLLFTNDGELAKRLMHPSSNISKLYHVETDKPVRYEDLKKITGGIELEDGIATVDAVEYDHPVLKTHIGLQIHEGRNRIVRRIFESLGYEIHKLDRTMFAGLTKKDLPRGRWRHLSEMEVNMLKMLTGRKEKKA
jgi:23S rRNA pseudouridine2605 synthase